MPRLPDPRFATDCHLVVDGRRVPARTGESVASALVAAGRPLLARSPKYHRPRGPFCLAGSCGSCLVRVSGLPNQRACRIPCRDGLAVGTQNALPSAAHDVLGVVDRVYSHGLDHHRLMTWNPIANRALVALSRQLAGVGRMPDTVAPILPAPGQERFDAVVVGAGPAGLAAAEVLAAAGRRVLVADQEPSPGGRLRCRLGLRGDPPPEWIEEACAAVRRAGGEIAVRAPVLGRWLDGGPLLAVLWFTPSPRLRLVRAPRLVVATGAHAEPPSFEDNDLPGIFSARGLLAALAEHGVVPGRAAAVLGAGPEAAGTARALSRAGMRVTRPVNPIAAHGARRVAALELADSTTVDCDTVVVVGHGSPAAELLREAGARCDPDVVTGELRLVAPGPEVAAGVFAAGEVLGPMTAADAVASGRRAGEAARG